MLCSHFQGLSCYALPVFKFLYDDIIKSFFVVKCLGARWNDTLNLIFNKASSKSSWFDQPINTSVLFGTLYTIQDRLFVCFDFVSESVLYHHTGKTSLLPATNDSSEKMRPDEHRRKKNENYKRKHNIQGKKQEVRRCEH